MARCRNLKPGFFHNERLAELPPLTRLLFAGLWCYADRDGRLEDRPKRLKAEILPYDDMDVDAALDTLAAGDDPFIIRYEAEGSRYIQVCKFAANQAPHKTEKASVIPPPLDIRYLTEQQQPHFKGIEVDGLEGEEGGAGGNQKRRKQIKAADVPVPPELDTPEVKQAIQDWLDYKAANGSTYKDGSYLGRKVAEFIPAGPAGFIAAVNSSIGNNYNGIFPAKNHHGSKQTPRTERHFKRGS